uniref:Large ribosomal subunit protein bL19m n=1 Tax=Strigamia maritima TaxID=126957 RepID=T1IY20_STRMM
MAALVRLLPKLAIANVNVLKRTCEVKICPIIETSFHQCRRITNLIDYRLFYPEFLPNPDMSRRHKVREKLERMDMLKRRTVLEIPEFYVGSILAVTVSDPNAPGKKSRFVGICIQRGEHGLRAFFILRNRIDGHGVELKYDLYNPTIQTIEVLKLEKRLDDDLTYLRDALPEYYTIPFDLEPIPHPKGTPVPLNPIKVKLKPRPWDARYERMDLQGVQDLGLPERFYKRAKQLATPWEKYDLMKQYRTHIHEEDQMEIFSEVDEHHQQMVDTRRTARKQRVIERPKKTA